MWRQIGVNPSSSYLLFYIIITALIYYSMIYTFMLLWCVGAYFFQRFCCWKRVFSTQCAHTYHDLPSPSWEKKYSSPSGLLSSGICRLTSRERHTPEASWQVLSQQDVPLPPGHHPLYLSTPMSCLWRHARRVIQVPALNSQKTVWRHCVMSPPFCVSYKQWVVIAAALHKHTVI